MESNLFKNKDYLNFENNSSVKRVINNETILFTDKIIKINRHGVSQERNIVITTLGIYNLKKRCKNIIL
jgi:hypothetical protein